MADEAGSTAPASDAFQALGSESRMAVLRSLADDEPKTFSELFDASSEDTTAGFAYHLRQLTGLFVQKRDDERYELTYAGRAVVRAIPSGTYTESVDREDIGLDDDCPFCGETALAATVEDNVTRVFCRDCDSPVLRLSFPPSGYRGRDEADLAAAFDAHHRHRIEAFGDGVCPECGGVVTARLRPVEPVESDDEASTDEDHVPIQAAFDCETCGSSLRCPVSLTVLSHPAVVAFYHDHGVDITSRPLWNVGSEWRERRISRDPWCLGIRTRLDDEELHLYVARDGRVVDARRQSVTDRETESEETNDASEDGTTVDGAAA
ncbi:hypothetical protein SAMN04487950_3973 [Halogranum rubrum]|uniref:Uncharacterized protein n=1 Tax=Halogranum rubrum TaxID=553466 RepID=A0A1I4I4S3_9EURY|nr:helix-turn-helix domain-containing protein [Halogranum rubrum]SFL49442.1 hypothetical protein SAMN04487950_3973 [Halogranum rubrum]